MSLERSAIELAILSYGAAGEYQQAADLLGRQAEIWMRQGEVSVIDRALRQLPQALVAQDLSLCIWSGWVQTLVGELEHADNWVQQADYLLKKTFPTPQCYTDRELNAYQNTAGQIDAIRGLIALRAGDRGASIAACRQALALLPASDPALRIIATTTMTLAGLDLAKADSALADLRQLRRTAFATNQPFVLLSILMHEVGWLINSGQLHDAYQISKRALAYMEEEPNTALTAPARLRLGQLAYLWNDLVDAQQHMATGLATAYPEFALATLEGYITLSRIHVAQGHINLAYDALHSAEQFARSVGRHSACERIAAWEARLHLMQGDTAAALRWAKQSGSWGLLADLPANFAARIDQVLTFCRLLMLLADAESMQRAEAILCRVLQRAIDHQLMLLQIEARVLLIGLYVARGSLDRAVSLLAETLGLVETSGAVRLLIEDGPQIWIPLSRLAQAGPLRSMAKRIQDEIQLNPPQQLRAMLHEQLSDHELAILQLLAEGCSNAEIARHQTLAISTVQWYLKQIYRKLEVHNRTQAAMRARDLNLLSSTRPPSEG